MHEKDAASDQAASFCSRYAIAAGAPHAPVYSSTQSNVRVTAFFHWA